MNVFVVFHVRYKNENRKLHGLFNLLFEFCYHYKNKALVKRFISVTMNIETGVTNSYPFGPQSYDFCWLMVVVQRSLTCFICYGDKEVINSGLTAIP